jgi:exo-beta-1,3-glucanase (GH17 family)
MGGAYLRSSDTNELTSAIDQYKNAIDQYAGGSWDVLSLFSVENERVDQHAMTASQVVDAINSARSQLRALGYNGPVGAVETAPAMIDNPAICEASDIAMCNIHAFFDRNTQASDAGTFVRGELDRVKAACNKRVVVTESGWPHQGDANGAAVPSPENQRMAMDSIRANFNSDMFLFSAFDSGWKSDSASTFNAERYWGTIE